MDKAKNSPLILITLLFNLIIFLVSSFVFFKGNTIVLIITTSICANAIWIVVYYLFQSTKSKTTNPSSCFFPETNNFFLSSVEDSKKLNILVNNHQLQREQIEFPSLNNIKSQKTNKDFVLIFTKDFRTIRLHKDEVQNFCYALIESHYSYFVPGVHDIQLIVKTTIPNPVTPPPPPIV